MKSLNLRDKVFLGINALLVCAVFVGNYFYLTEGGLLLKGLCSGGFTLIGLVNLVYALLNQQKDLKYPVSMLIGFILAMLGDLFIGENFIVGAALFALGHISFVVGYCVVQRFNRLDAIFGGLIFAGAAIFLLFCPWLSFDQPLFQWVCLVYALIISVMVGKAIANLVHERTLTNGVLAVGGVLFFFSDLMLVFDWFAGMSTGKLCMATYYPALCALAVSVYLFGLDKNLQKE